MSKELILAFETSCDETAACVFDSKNKKILSHTVYSQIETHKIYGGVIPELASKEHLEKINIITEDALKKADLNLNDITHIAATTNPGLSGSLLVGTCFAKSIAAVKNIPFIAVNHLEGHAFSAFVESEIEFPSICITASGGHTSIYFMTDYGQYSTLGTTRDDAAGEVFDKIAKLLDLEYPGGPIIERLAKKVNFQDFFFYPRGSLKGYEMSFSGLKTAILYDLVKKGYYDLTTKTLINKSEELKEQVSSSLLVCIKDIFISKLDFAFKEFKDCKAICFVGGVACNKYLKEELKNFSIKKNRKFFSPSSLLCTDNAAMIAFVAAYKIKNGEFSTLETDIF